MDKTLYQLTDNDSVLNDGLKPYILRVKDLPLDKQPRQKLIANGPELLTVAELVAILLGVGTKKEEVMIMANRILRDYGERSIVSEKNPKHLSNLLEIPLPKACQLIASFELGRRFYQVKSGKAVFISTAQQAFDYLRDMGTMKKEQLRGLYLNSRYQVVHEEVISIGSLTSSIVHPREVFQPAIEYGAIAVIVAHNHPSGRLEGSLADIEATERLVIAGNVLGIELIDHLVIANDNFVSILPK